MLELAYEWHGQAGVSLARAFVALCRVSTGRQKAACPCHPASRQRLRHGAGRRDDRDGYRPVVSFGRARTAQHCGRSRGRPQGALVRGVELLHLHLCHAVLDPVERDMLLFRTVALRECLAISKKHTAFLCVTVFILVFHANPALVPTRIALHVKLDSSELDPVLLNVQRDDIGLVMVKLPV